MPATKKPEKPKAPTMVSADDHAPELVEALRRWLCFAVRRDGEKIDRITTAWTGLGTRNDGYGRMERFGLMRDATACIKGNTWWTLTDKGSAIVKRWLAEGFIVGEGWAVIHPKGRRPTIDKADLRSK